MARHYTMAEAISCVKSLQGEIDHTSADHPSGEYCAVCDGDDLIEFLEAALELDGA